VTEPSGLPLPSMTAVTQELQLVMKILSAWPEISRTAAAPLVGPFPENTWFMKMPLTLRVGALMARIAVDSTGSSEVFT
jgi:hypothetical protein